MDLSTLQKALETAPVKMTKIVAEIEAKQKEGKTLEFFLEAVRLLRVSWKDADPGKYTAHWHAFKGGRKAWPRELIEGAAADRRPSPETIFAFKELDAANCPACKKLSLLVSCYQQTEDGPFGDTWVKQRYALCDVCQALYRLGQPHVSSGRF